MHEIIQTARIREYYFTEISLKIKCWGVVVSALAVGMGFNERSAMYFLLGGASALIFWATEILWKYWQCTTMQRDYGLYVSPNSRHDWYSRSFFNSEISEKLKSNRNTIDKYLCISICLNVAVPHMIVFLSCTSMWFLYYFGFI
jgi:hypothetical protein